MTTAIESATEEATGLLDDLLELQEVRACACVYLCVCVYVYVCLSLSLSLAPRVQRSLFERLESVETISKTKYRPNICVCVCVCACTRVRVLVLAMSALSSPLLGVLSSFRLS